ncbi:hypothetical protein U9M48_029021, partial [Paspalum notatum var. saurae]
GSHDWPLKLKDESDKFAAGQTKSEKEAIRQKAFKMAKEKYILTFHPKRQNNIVYSAYFPAPLSL